MVEDERGKMLHIATKLLQWSREIMVAGGMGKTGGCELYFARSSDGLDVESGLRGGGVADDFYCIKVSTFPSLPSFLIHFPTHHPSNLPSIYHSSSAKMA